MLLRVAVVEKEASSNRDSNKSYKTGPLARVSNISRVVPVFLVFILAESHPIRL